MMPTTPRLVIPTQARAGWKVIGTWRRWGGIQLRNFAALVADALDDGQDLHRGCPLHRAMPEVLARAASISGWRARGCMDLASKIGRRCASVARLAQEGALE